MGGGEVIMKKAIAMMASVGMVMATSADITEFNWQPGDAGTAVAGDYILTYTLNPGVNLLDFVSNGKIALADIPVAYAVEEVIIGGLWPGEIWSTDGILGDAAIAGLNVQAIISSTPYIEEGSIINISAVAGPVVDLQPDPEIPRSPGFQSFDPNTVTTGIQVHGAIPQFSLFEYSQASNAVHLEWINGANAFFELESSTNLLTGLWGSDAGGTNILGTMETNSVYVSCGDSSNQFFRLITRSNSPQQRIFGGMALRANTTLVFDGFAGVPPYEVPQSSLVCIWDESNTNYIWAVSDNRAGWQPSLMVSNNQSFYYFPSTGEDVPSGWSYAYAKDWRLTSPEDLPVTGDVLMEWTAFESYSTPSNPLPEIPVVNVSVMNSDEVVVTNWILQASESSSVIWESQTNPDGYYTIKVDLAGLELIEKQVYLYNK